jgi:hypothetical protein
LNIDHKDLSCLKFEEALFVTYFFNFTYFTFLQEIIVQPVEKPEPKKRTRTKKKNIQTNIELNFEPNVETNFEQNIELNFEPPIISEKIKNGVSKVSSDNNLIYSSNPFDTNQVDQLQNDENLEFFAAENDVDYVNDDYLDDDENTNFFNDEENTDFLNDDATFDVEDTFDEEADFEEFGSLSALFVINHYKVVFSFS